MEIFLALAVKFLLLAAVWFFFVRHQPPADGVHVARAFLGERQTTVTSTTYYGS